MYLTSCLPRAGRNSSPTFRVGNWLLFAMWRTTSSMNSVNTQRNEVLKIPVRLKFILRRLVLASLRLPLVIGFEELSGSVAREP